MCGACGRHPSDWSVPLVSGPRRRAAIARFLSSVCRGITVRDLPARWSVTSMTGAGRVAGTFDELLDSVASRCVPRTWGDLEQALAQFESRERNTAGPHSPGYRPPEAAVPVSSAQVVLTVPYGGSLPLRLAAFGLGARSFDKRGIALDARLSETPFVLLALAGTILGSAPLDVGVEQLTAQSRPPGGSACCMPGRPVDRSTPGHPHSQS